MKPEQRELKTCPFCGSSKIWQGIYSGSPSISCDCGASMGGEESTVSASILLSAWNQRAQVEALVVPREPFTYTVDGIVMSTLEYIDYMHRQYAGERLRADQGWERYESANRDRNALRAEIAKRFGAPSESEKLAARLSELGITNLGYTPGSDPTVSRERVLKEIIRAVERIQVGDFGLRIAHESDVLHPKEASFVLRVMENPGAKLREGSNDWGDEYGIGPFWTKPEALGLIECVGNYSWTVTGALSLAVRRAKLKAVNEFANSAAPTIPAIPGTKEGA